MTYFIRASFSGFVDMATGKKAQHMFVFSSHFLKVINSAIAN